MLHENFSHFPEKNVLHILTYFKCSNKFFLGCYPDTHVKSLASLHLGSFSPGYSQTMQAQVVFKLTNLLPTLLGSGIKASASTHSITFSNARHEAK